MNKILLLTCCFLITTSVVLAEDTTTETCANGSGTVVIGTITGHKYCRSSQRLNFWNAYAWCDGLNRRLVDSSNCACGNITADCANNGCPEFKNAAQGWLWSGVPNNSISGHFIDTLGGYFGVSDYSNPLSALCY